jgi:hypothetical protein
MISLGIQVILKLLPHQGCIFGIIPGFIKIGLGVKKLGDGLLV